MTYKQKKKLMYILMTQSTHHAPQQAIVSLGCGDGAAANWQLRE